MSSETVVQQRTRLMMAERMAQMWRNNSGAAMIADEKGVERMVRWGLANDSAQLNKEIKSSDLIGSTPTLITPEMVGRYLGVFTALEIKPSNWHMTPGDERAKAQERFHLLVLGTGGYAGFVTNPAIDIPRIVGR